MATTFLGSAATQRINGDGQDFEGLVIFQNARGSNRIVNIRRLLSQLDATATSTSLLVPCLTYRGTGEPNLTGACRATKCAFDTTKTSDGFVQMWYAVTPDGSNDAGMSGTSGATAWRQWACRLRSAAEQQQAPDNNQLPMLIAQPANKWRLYPGEYMLVRVDPVALADNTTGNGWFVECVWEEETLPTFTVSGTVTNGGIGVVGAKVTVMVADDTSLTNAYLWQVVTSTSGGAWACEIPAGKMAFAYAQNYTTGTYYTAPGAPFIS